MLKQYEELLAALKKAQEIAGAIHQKGGPTDRVYRGLAHPIREVQARISYMNDAIEREKAKAAEAKREAAKKKTEPQLPGEPCPVPTPEQLEQAKAAANAKAVSTGPAAAVAPANK